MAPCEWVIDIIKEWVLAQLYATEAWVTAKGYLTTGFVRRVSQADYDWTDITLVEDGNWRELDCSAIVPAGAKAILFQVQIRNSAIDKRLRLRYPSDANAPGWLRFNTQVANIYRLGEMIMSCDANRKIEYYFTAGGWTGERISILGWWL